MDYYLLTPLFLVLRLLEFFSQFTLVISITKAKIPMKKLFLGTFMYVLLFEISEIIVPQYLTSISSILFSVPIVVFIFKFPWKKAIVSCVIMGLTVAIVDCVISICLVKTFGISTFIELSQTETMAAIGKIIISVSILLIANIINVTINKPVTNKTEYITNNIEFVTIIGTFFLLFPNLVMVLYYHDQKPVPLYIIVVNVISIISMFFINLFNTRRGIKFIQSEEELVTERLHNKTQGQLVDSLRTFKHDYGNLLQTMHGYIYTKDMDGLTEYFEQVLIESKIITALDKLNPELFDNSSLYGLVTAKFEYARRNNVVMNLEMYTKLNNLEIGNYDLTRILGILFDNAIEASIGSKKKIVNFYVMERNNKVTIEISNSFSNKELKLEDIYKKSVSSKGKNRGLGLYKVQDILNKYPNITRDTKINNDMFLQSLIINKVKLPILR